MKRKFKYSSRGPALISKEQLYRKIDRALEEVEKGGEGLMEFGEFLEQLKKEFYLK